MLAALANNLYIAIWLYLRLDPKKKKSESKVLWNVAKALLLSFSCRISFQSLVFVCCC